MRHALSGYARTKLTALRETNRGDDVGSAWRELLSDFVHHARYLGLDALESEQRGESTFRLCRGNDRIVFQIMRGSGQPRIASSASRCCERLTERLTFDRAAGKLVDTHGCEPMDALVEEVCLAFGRVESGAPPRSQSRLSSTSAVRPAARSRS